MKFSSLLQAKMSIFGINNHSVLHHAVVMGHTNINIGFWEYGVSEDCNYGSKCVCISWCL